MTIDAIFTAFPTLTTKRLRLRQIRPDDADAVFAITSDEEAMRFTGHGKHQSLDDTRAYIQRHMALYAERRSILWGVILGEDDRVIGSCSLHHFDDGYHRAEVGYELNRAFWGQGIMAEAVSAIIRYGFTEMALHRVEAIIDIANERSKNLLLRLGFQYEGNLRQRYYMRGSFEDEHYYGLLRDEWSARLSEDTC
jgi:ribosomal-protein-alanine N-acetyltransferase